jgi:DNA replication protein DnaC
MVKPASVNNTLAAAQSAGRLKREIGRYLKPGLLIIDELGYLPIDKYGADLLFQIISQRYERAPMAITTNRAYKPVADLQQRQHAHFRHPRPRPSPRRYGPHRG